MKLGASQVVLVVKNLLDSAGDTRDTGSVPGLGRFHGTMEEGMTTNLLQYSWTSLVAQLVKNPPTMRKDLGSIPGLGRSPREGKGYPLQYSGLEKFMNSSLHMVMYQFSSVQFSLSVMSDSLRPHESQHARPPCPSPTLRVHSD